MSQFPSMNQELQIQSILMQLLLCEGKVPQEAFVLAFKSGGNGTKREQVVAHGEAVAHVERSAPVAGPEEHRIDLRAPAPREGRFEEECPHARAPAIREDVDVGDVRVKLGLLDRI